MRWLPCVALPTGAGTPVSLRSRTHQTQAAWAGLALASPLQDARRPAGFPRATAEVGLALRTLYPRSVEMAVAPAFQDRELALRISSVCPRGVHLGLEKYQ